MCCISPNYSISKKNMFLLTYSKVIFLVFYYDIICFMTLQTQSCLGVLVGKVRIWYKVGQNCQMSNNLSLKIIYWHRAQPGVKVGPGDVTLTRNWLTSRSQIKPNIQQQSDTLEASPASSHSVLGLENFINISM